MMAILIALCFNTRQSHNVVDGQSSSVADWFLVVHPLPRQLLLPFLSFPLLLFVLRHAVFGPLLLGELLRSLLTRQRVEPVLGLVDGLIRSALARHDGEGVGVSHGCVYLLLLLGFGGGAGDAGAAAVAVVAVQTSFQF